MHNYKVAVCIYMCIARNSDEVAILVYFKRGGLEKQRGDPPHSSYIRGKFPLIYEQGFPGKPCFVMDTPIWIKFGCEVTLPEIGLCHVNSVISTKTNC